MKLEIVPRPAMSVRMGSVLPSATLIFVAIVGVGLTCTAVGVREGPFRVVGWIGDILIRRGYFPFFTVSVFALTMSIVLSKCRLIHRQQGFLRQEPAPVDIDFADPDAVGAYSDRMRANPRFEENMLTTRCAHLLEAWLAGSAPDRIAHMAGKAIEYDRSVRDETQRLLHRLLWLIVMLGVVGTLTGMSGTVGGFARVMEAGDSLVHLKEGLRAVAISLLVAFDTASLALILAAITMFAHATAGAKEDAMIRSVDAFVEDHIIAKLRSDEHETSR